jgi:hypothetical protein
MTSPVPAPKNPIPAVTSGEMLSPVEERFFEAFLDAAATVQRGSAPT